MIATNNYDVIFCQTILKPIQRIITGCVKGHSKFVFYFLFLYFPHSVRPLHTPLLFRSVTNDSAFLFHFHTYSLANFPPRFLKRVAYFYTYYTYIIITVSLIYWEHCHFKIRNSRIHTKMLTFKCLFVSHQRPIKIAIKTA